MKLGVLLRCRIKGGAASLNINNGATLQKTAPQTAARLRFHRINGLG